MHNHEQLTDAALVSGNAKTPEPVELRSAHDYALVTAALEHRAADLDKLAKKNDEEGYAREARAVRADATAINSHILPQFREQPDLPVVTSQQIETALQHKIAVHVARAFRNLDDPKIVVSEMELTRRREKLIADLASGCALFGIEIAREAWNQGYAVREMTEEFIVSKFTTSLSATAE